MKQRVTVNLTDDAVEMIENLRADSLATTGRSNKSAEVEDAIRQAFKERFKDEEDHN